VCFVIVIVITIDVREGGLVGQWREGGMQGSEEMAVVLGEVWEIER
jgi:hypothetical protein